MWLTGDQAGCGDTCPNRGERGLHEFVKIMEYQVEKNMQHKMEPEFVSGFMGLGLMRVSKI